MTGTSIERATRSAVRCRVPVSEVGHVRVGHQVHVGPGDAAGVGGQDDGAVHLGQLGEPLRAEGGVEQEPARADVEHLGPVADDDRARPCRPAGCGRGPRAAACPARRRRARRAAPRCAGGLTAECSRTARGAGGGSAHGSRSPHGRRVGPIGSVAHGRRRPARRGSSAGERDGVGERRPAAARCRRRLGRERGHDGRGGSPSRAASARRRSRWATWRSSPPRPTSPQATRSAGQRPAGQRRRRRPAPTPRSAPGSTTRTPPTARA